MSATDISFKSKLLVLKMLQVCRQSSATSLKPPESPEQDKRQAHQWVGREYRARREGTARGTRAALRAEDTAGPGEKSSADPRLLPQGLEPPCQMPGCS